MPSSKENGILTEGKGSKWKLKKLLTWKGVANFAILGTAKWLSPKSHKALLDMTADKSWHYNNSRRHCWIKTLNSLNQSGMYEQGCWSTAQVTPGICHLQFFLFIFQICENCGECVFYLRGDLSENDQQQGFHNGSAPLCNRPCFLRLPHT